MSLSELQTLIVYVVGSAFLIGVLLSLLLTFFKR